MDNPALVMPPPIARPGHFVKFGDSMICTICNLDVRYCKGHVSADPPSGDGADSDLIRRVRECTGGR